MEWLNTPGRHSLCPPNRLQELCGNRFHAAGKAWKMLRLGKASVTRLAENRPEA